MMAENEIILLRRFAESGDAEAFSEIVRRHAGLVYGACLRVLEDKSRAADAVQETFLQLFRNAKTITGSVPNWLHTVATRKAIDLIRRDHSRKQREAKYAGQKQVEVTKWEDISLYVDECLSELDDETREILIQYFFEGRSTSDVAAEKGISQPTVSRKIESGVSLLRGQLQRRGIIVTVVTLGGLLGQSAVEAAPALVLKELGKMALVGGPAVAASGAGVGAAGGGAKAAAGGVLTGIKTKVITAAAVAAVGVGGVVTYQNVTQEPQPPAETPTSTVQRKEPVQNTRTVQKQRQAVYDAAAFDKTFEEEAFDDEMGEEFVDYDLMDESFVDEFEEEGSPVM
ncbi:MAG: RNA polymerase sigma factor, partial [Planctomycetota bacterium]